MGINYYLRVKEANMWKDVNRPAYYFYLGRSIHLDACPCEAEAYFDELEELIEELNYEDVEDQPLFSLKLKDASRLYRIYELLTYLQTEFASLTIAARIYGIITLFDKPEVEILTEDKLPKEHNVYYQDDNVIIASK